MSKKVVTFRDVLSKARKERTEQDYEVLQNALDKGICTKQVIRKIRNELEKREQVLNGSR